MSTLMNRTTALIPVFLPVFTCLGLGTAESANRPPVADAGSSRYAAREPVTFDGSGSFDADGDEPLLFSWRQVDGPAVTISGEDTPAPTISDIVQTGQVQRITFELVVSDLQASSAPDRVELIVVPEYHQDTVHIFNPPFRPELPTIIGFNGGNCVLGGPLALDERWYTRVNYLTGAYNLPYEAHGDAIIAYLSRVAPDYDQRIQILGFSTGGNPAIAIANHLNQTYADPRYNVNRVTLLDASCIDFAAGVNRFNSNPVASEQAWVDCYRVNENPIPYALNLNFPWGAHNTPPDWFIGSISPDHWPDGDMYNHGLTGAYFVSIIGPAKNLQLATDDTYYYFQCPDDRIDCLQHMDQARFPGVLPQPVTLIGPADGDSVGSEGAILSCEVSEQATSYQLLFGPDPRRVDELVSETLEPPNAVIRTFPYAPTYWTIRVRDAWGSTIHADPLALHPDETTGAVRRGIGPRVRPTG